MTDVIRFRVVGGALREGNIIKAPGGASFGAYIDIYGNLLSEKDRFGSLRWQIHASMCRR
jgi:hypothetical protein